MQKGHKAPRGCFQGKSFSNCPPRFGRLNGQNLELKHTNGVKQANDTETDFPEIKLQQENHNVWSSFPPNSLEEIHSQLHPFDRCFYPSNQGQYFPTNWFPKVPLQLLLQGQNYAPDYGLQDFDYFVVIDFEATCESGKKIYPQEIIEFPSVLVNSRTGQVEDCFQIYVRPIHNQMLTEFCKELTGIQQAQVDEGVLLSEALLTHDKWLEDKGIKHTRFAIVTWSNWDCRVMLESECLFKNVKKPSYFDRWINLKIPFGEVFGGARCNLKEAVELAGLTWEGRAHCGLDDAKNTACLLVDLMRRGFKFSITDKILRESPDHSHTHLTHTPSPSPPNYGLFPKFKSLSSSPFLTLIPFQPTNNPSAKGPHVFCYCGATSTKKLLRKPGSMHGNLFFVCGNWTANRGAVCPFLKCASDSGNTP